MSRLSRQLFVPLCLGLSLAWAPLTPAAEIDLLANALGFADCLDPPLSAPAGLGSHVICGTRLYGPTDEFVGRTDLLTRGGWINPAFPLGYVRVALHKLESEPAQSPIFANRFEELRQQLLDGRALTPDITRELLNVLLYEDGFALLGSSEFPALLARSTRDDLLGFYSSIAQNFRNVPSGLLSLMDPTHIRRSSVTFVVGPDGVNNSSDDLPTLTSGSPRLTVVPQAGTGFLDDAIDDVVIYTLGDGSTVELYGRFNDTVVVETGCGLAGGVFDAATGTCSNGAGSDITAEVFDSGCRRVTDNNRNGGINSDGGGAFSGRCVQLRTGVTRIPFPVLDGLRDLSVRPTNARIGPFDLTDFALLASAGLTPPARPRSPRGTLQFPAPCDRIGARPVDPDTGAPVNVTGALSCKYRAADGSATGDLSLSVGPDGVAGTDDDRFPTVGNCLLWENPPGANTQQTVRSADLVAGAHAANQSLFHTLCTLSFDRARVLCPLDEFNHPTFFGFVSEILVGNALIGELAIDGVQRIRTGAAPYSNLIPTVVELAFQGTARLGGAQGDLGNLALGQQALLGCGPAFAWPCGIEQRRAWVGAPGPREDPNDTSIGDAIERDLSTVSGGLDLMNADLDAVSMEFTLRKFRDAGDLMGTRSDFAGNKYFELGVEGAGMTVNEVNALGNAGRTEFVHRQNEIAELNLLHTFILDDDDPLHDPTFDTAGNPDAIAPVATDAWIEPFPWLPDPNLLAQRILVYQIANRFELDPRCHEVEGQEQFFDDGGNIDANGICRTSQGNRIGDTSGGQKIFNNPFDLTNPLNVFSPDLLGESCVAGFRFGFDAGCTELEDVSANLERYLLSTDIVGPDRVPDPYESLEEFQKMTDDDPNNDFTADPLSGPDGIFVANFASGLGNLAVPGRFETDAEFGDEVDIQVVRLVEAKQATTTTIDLRTLEAKEAFMASALVDCPAETSDGICYARVGDDTPFPLQGFDNDAADATLPLVAVLPATLPVVIDGFLFGHVNFLKLWFQNPDLAMQLLDPLNPFIVLDLEDGTTAEIFLAGVNPLVQFFGNQTNSVVLSDCQNLDDDEKCDWDQDSDFVYDGADDYTRGPGADDGASCGSGLPGDVLQDALQLELARPADRRALALQFPNGFPPRSPVFCRGLLRFLGYAGESAPGRLDAIWHGGKRPGDADGDGWPDSLGACALEEVVCGDVNVDQNLGAADVSALRGFFADPSGAPLSPEGASRCSVAGGAGDCDILDLVVLRRTLHTPALPPGILSVCGAARP